LQQQITGGQVAQFYLRMLNVSIRSNLRFKKRKRFANMPYGYLQSLKKGFVEK